MNLRMHLSLIKIWTRVVVKHVKTQGLTGKPVITTCFPLLKAFRGVGVRTVVAAPQESWAAAWSQSIGSKWAPVSVS